MLKQISTPNPSRAMLCRNLDGTVQLAGSYGGKYALMLIAVAETAESVTLSTNKGRMDRKIIVGRAEKFRQLDEPIRIDAANSYVIVERVGDKVLLNPFASVDNTVDTVIEGETVPLKTGTTHMEPRKPLIVNHSDWLRIVRPVVAAPETVVSAPVVPAIVKGKGKSKVTA